MLGVSITQQHTALGEELTRTAPAASTCQQFAYTIAMLVLTVGSLTVKFLDWTSSFGTAPIMEAKRL